MTKSDGETTSESVLVAIGVNGEGYREILGAAKGASESKECWRDILLSLRERGLQGVRQFTSSKHLGFLESESEVFPDAKGVAETLTYLDFPREHWRNIRTNIILERLNREIHR